MTYQTERIVTSWRTEGPYLFEFESVEVSLIRSEGRRYLRVYHRACSAEANGRPVTSTRDVCYPIAADADVTEANWRSFAHLLNQIDLAASAHEGLTPKAN